MVRKFKPEEMTQKSTILIIGKRNRGKSTLAADLLRYFKCPKAIIFSATDGCSGFYAKHFPKEYIFDEYDTDTLARIVKLQKGYVKQDKPLPAQGYFWS